MNTIRLFFCKLKKKKSRVGTSSVSTDKTPIFFLMFAKTYKLN